MIEQPHMPKYPLHTLSKALEILNYIKDSSSSDGVTLNTISKDLEISKSSAHRILDTLLYYGFVEKNSSVITKYRLSWGAYKVGIAVPKYHTLNSSNYAPLLEKLSQEINKTVTLSVQNEYVTITLYKVESDSYVPLQSHLGKHNPLYATASGKLFMLEFSQEEIRNYFKNTEIKKYTSNTILNFIDFLDELNIVKAKGYSMDNCEYEENTICIAMAIKDYTKKTIAAISISDSAEKMTTEDIKFIKEKLKTTCDTISKYLGY